MRNLGPKPARIPFAVAITEAKLLKPWFDALSLPQQVALKVSYGCSLSNDIKDDRGWGELDYWAMMQESCKLDELGYLTAVTPIPYTPQEYNEVWMMAGIRAGKSASVAATITAYEATCGGHESHTRGDRPIVCFQIAQDLRLAKYSLHSILAVLKTMFWFKDSIGNVTADRIELTHGVHIGVTPPTVKSIRGYDSPVAVLDECSVWWTEADSANPDFELYNQAVSRQAQFEFPKIVGISSPWTRQGLLYRRWEAGTNGCKLICDDCRESPRPVVGCKVCERLRRPHQSRLVLHATSAGLGSPAVKHNWLVNQLAADPRNFMRECLAHPLDSVSGFLDSEKLGQAVDKGIVEREPDTKLFYVAAMDPAFRNDAFAFTIVHCEPAKGIVQDVVRQWTPAPGISLNPAEILVEIAALLKHYAVFTVYSDQYQFESLQQLAMNLGFSIEPVDFTASSKAGIYGNLKSLVSQRKLRLLDHPGVVRELRQLESKLTQGGNIQISAPTGSHDDLATVVALAAQKAIWMLPVVEQVQPSEPTPHQQIMKQLTTRLVRDDWED